MGPGSASLACEVAGPGIDAVAHVLAHLRLPPGAPTLVRAASLFDPRYVRWCEASLDEAAVSPIARDAPMLGALLADAEEGHLLQALLGLHREPEVLRRAAVLELEAPGLASLEPVALAMARRLARAHPALVEITRCVVGLVAGPYQAAYVDAVGPEVERGRRGVDDAAADLVEAIPSLVGTRVLLSHPLGARGRVLPGMLLVGAPSGWSGVGAPTIAAVIAHEHAVQLAGEVVDADRSLDGTGRWALTERLALDAVRLRLREGAVAEAHRAHVAGLDTSALPRDLRGPGAVLLEELLDRLGSRARASLPGHREGAPAS